MKGFVTAIFTLLLFFAGLSPNESPGKDKGRTLRQGAAMAMIDPALLEAAQHEEELDFLIVLKFQTALEDAFRYQQKEIKAEYVFNELRTTTEANQHALLSFLKGKASEVQAYYIVNAIRVKGPATLLSELAAMPVVKQLLANPWLPLEQPQTTAAAQLRGPNEVEWGIQNIGADAVWEMGYRGAGVVIGGQDTGYDWQHPSLRDKYRGWNGTTADHAYNWHDAIREINPLHGDSTLEERNNPCGFNSPFPCDDGNHGTHTMGTMVGSTADNRIGVAPEARWIACRNMERGYGSPSTYLECFEWFLAPTDLNNENPDPGKAPHVINNSWSCPEKEGCTAETFALLQRAVDNLKKAGTVVVVSAGNSGRDGCGSVRTPSAIFEESFTIGASTKEDSIASFSSRGPVEVDGSGRLKPNVVAPGVGVRSCIPNGGYASFSGTSMAGPHVAGLVALLISARPALAGQVELIEDIIEQTALKREATLSCAGLALDAIPNASYGHGRVDALAAVNYLFDLLAPEGVAQLRAFPNPFGESLRFEIQNI
ncbi:MAG: S8 family serine peptidase, partial [Bacteroidota bacterium]